MQPLVDLRLGDCLKLMHDLPDKSVDLILCDLPYGTTAIEWDKPLPFEAMWQHYERIIKDKAAIILFSSQPFTTELIASNRKLFRYEIIWKKTTPTGFLNANKAPLRTHENICVFYKKLPTYNPIKFKVEPNDLGRVRHVKGIRAKQYRDMGGVDWTETGERFPGDVIEFSNWNGVSFGKKRKDATKHPTQKPVDLCAYLIETYTNPGDMVLDNCMGSGSTGVACIKTGRSFIGMEIKPEYFALSESRVREAQAQPNLLVGLTDGLSSFNQEGYEMSKPLDNPPKRPRGRPTKLGEKMVQTAVWLPREQIEWLRMRGNISEQIRKLIEREMQTQIRGTG